MEQKTTLAYEVVTFSLPIVDRDLTVRVNEEKRRVEGWGAHLGPVRVVSLSINHGRCFLTIEYTAYAKDI